MSLAPIIVVVGILILTIIVQAVVSKNFNYKCGNCGNEFSISPVTGVLTPHNMGRKLLKCPSCGKITWARRVRKNATDL
jgi:DNA-directed RNA polymerase subunit RPC12/RpoP